MEQQPRDPVRVWARLRVRAMWTPTTSCPASTARAAATAESTPPDRAARTRTGVSFTATATAVAGYRRSTAMGEPGERRQRCGDRHRVVERKGVMTDEYAVDSRSSARMLRDQR